jgi:hypothetical protein
MTLSLVVSLLLSLIGIVLWFEVGPHPRPWEAWRACGFTLPAGGRCRLPSHQV